MSVISTKKKFSNGEQLTAAKLNQVIDQATFNASEAVDGSTLTLIGGAMAVNDDGITESKIRSGAVTTNKIIDSNVTKAKIEDVADMKVLGNTSGSAAAPEEVDILDEDDMSSDSATAIATQQSIKAYVDSAPNFTPSTYAGEESVTFPNGLIMKWGSVEISANSTSTVTFGTAFNTIVNAQVTWYVNSNTASSPCFLRSDIANASIEIRNNIGSTAKAYWQAIGY